MSKPIYSTIDSYLLFVLFWRGHLEKCNRCIYLYIYLGQTRTLRPINPHFGSGSIDKLGVLFFSSHNNNSVAIHRHSAQFSEEPFVAQRPLLFNSGSSDQITLEILLNCIMVRLIFSILVCFYLQSHKL